MPIMGKLEITIDDKGLVSVTGCLENRVLAYGLLAVAHDVIKDHNSESARLVQLAGVTPALLNRQ